VFLRGNADGDNLQNVRVHARRVATQRRSISCGRAAGAPRSVIGVLVGVRADGAGTGVVYTIQRGHIPRYE
jgi:hypothetical protein